MSEWIDVKERLPDEYCWCFVYAGDEVWIDSWNEKYECWNDASEDYITHWMKIELPEPPTK